MGYGVVKRGVDILSAATLLLLLLPLLAVLAILIRAETPGSPLFTQQRIGRRGKPFRFFKFRSMVKDAPLLGSWRTADNDPRITRVGKFLRATSLDELPQLWNVLIGDMSLIGPRPQTPQQQSLYTPEQWETRHRVRPGITGLAQVNGRSDILLEQQIAYDLAYTARPTLALDTSILLKTIALIFTRRGTN